MLPSGLTYVQENTELNRVQRANELICHDKHTGEAALTGLQQTGPGVQLRDPVGPAPACHRETPAAAAAVTPAISGLTNAACHSPSGGPSIRLHPGGSWEAGHRPALNKDILTFASGFSATSILKE